MCEGVVFVEDGAENLDCVSHDGRRKCRKGYVQRTLRDQRGSTG
jgi:hypothetical protein